MLVEEEQQLQEPGPADSNEPPRRSLERKKKRHISITEKENQEIGAPAQKEKKPPRKKPCRRKPKRNKTAKPETWFRNEQHEKRIHGQEYETRCGDIVPAKEKRYMENCNCIYRCHEKFDEDAQKKICRDYYASGQSPLFVSQNIIETQIVRKRSRLNDAKKQKNKSRQYYLPTSDLKKERVCQRFFCFILQISFRTVDGIMKNKTENGFLLPKSHGLSGRKPVNATPEDQLSIVKAHITSFPRIPSHYCRKDSRKLYLSPELNINIMYRLYKEYCAENYEDVTPVKDGIYRRVFYSFDPQLSFYVPKKDLCTTCEIWKQSSTHSEEFVARYEQHKAMELASLGMKKRDMANESPSHRCITFDMQANLSVPFAGDAQIYYKRKLSLFNFTIYDNTADGYCYLFDETNGVKGCNEVATCLLDYMENKLPASVTHLTTYSDTCAAQNRNSYFISMMIMALNRHPTLQQIDVRYLESGHTYLECDSMHATIERRLKKRKVYTPEQMEIIFQDARITPCPYKVKVMEFSDFLNFKSVPLLNPQTKDQDNASKGNFILFYFIIRLMQLNQTA